MTQDLISLTLAAKRINLGEPAIRKGLHQGKIRGQKMGRDWYIPADEVERLAREYPLENDPS